MVKKSTVVVGKAVALAAKLRGGGSALPGLVVERLDPHFLRNLLERLPRGVVVISGTNGKTTTTKMVVELLQSQDLKVFTNRTGSNFTRGIVSATLGELRNYELDSDIAVLELDEAHAVHFVREIAPRYCLILNVLRDQLDRFGEIDTTAKLLRKVAEHTTESVVLNREDTLVAGLAKHLKKQRVSYFGYAKNLATEFPNDDQLHGKVAKKLADLNAKVELTKLDGNDASYRIGRETFSTKLALSGSHNALNAAAALTLVGEILGKKTDYKMLVKSLAKIQPAFGRGESIEYNGQPIDLILVKNPSGFRLALKSQAKSDAATMIAINDNYADGRDMSWLWDVNFSQLKKVDMVSGVRAYDMALRLQYDDVEISEIEPDLGKALDMFLAANADRPKQIFCTYTAMLKLRKTLSRVTKVEAI